MPDPTEEDEVLDEKDPDESDKGEEDEKAEDKDEEVVPVRKSTINAQRRIIEKQGKKLAEKTSKDDKSDDDDSELTPKARRLIEDEVDRRVAPLQDELAFRDYFAAHPEDRKYQKQARARFDAWGNVPIEEVMKTLRSSVDADEKSKAQDKANRGSMKGGTARQETKVAQTQKELEEVYRKVKRGESGAALRDLGVGK